MGKTRIGLPGTVITEVGRGIGSPAVLGGFLLLALNDHLLKGLGPGFITGKISDFAGLFAFPFLCLSLGNVFFASLEGLRGSAQGPSRTLCRFSARRLLFVQLFIGILFVAVKISPAASAMYVDFLSALLGLPAWNCVDPLDCIALTAFLPAVLLARRLETRRPTEAEYWKPGNPRLVTGSTVSWTARRALVGVLLATTAVISLATSYPGEYLGEVLPAVSENPGAYSDPDIAGGETIPVSLVWSESNGTGSDVMYAVSNDQGRTFGAPRNLSGTPAVHSKRPRVSANDAGDVCVVWVEEPGSGPTDIYLRCSSDFGETFPVAPVNLSNTGGASGNPDILTRGAGILRVVWTDDTAGTTDVLYRDSLNGGSTLRPRVNVSNLSAPALAVETAVAELPLGPVFVGWTGEDGTGGTVRVSMSSDGGMSFSSSQLLTTGGGGFPVGIAMYGHGALMDSFLDIAWSEVDSRLSPTRSELFREVSIDGGATWGARMRITAGGTFEGTTGVDLGEYSYPYDSPCVVFDRTSAVGSGEIFMANLFYPEGYRLLEISFVTGEAGFGVKRDEMGLGHDFKSPRGSNPFVCVDERTGIWVGRLRYYSSR